LELERLQQNSTCQSMAHLQGRKLLLKRWAAQLLLKCKFSLYIFFKRSFMERFFYFQLLEIVIMPAYITYMNRRVR
jgi:hypothetical protein